MRQKQHLALVDIVQKNRCTKRHKRDLTRLQDPLTALASWSFCSLSIRAVSLRLSAFSCSSRFFSSRFASSSFRLFSISQAYCRLNSSFSSISA